MRALLVNPYDPADRKLGPPKMALGLAYVASMIRRELHADVRLLDKYAEYRLNGFDRAGTERLLDDALARHEPEVVGFTTYSMTIADVIKDARRVKQRLPRALVVIGGAHATACGEETLRRYDFIDIAVSGEGEHPMLDILGGESLSAIAGIAYRDQGRVVATAPRPPPQSVDDLPLPARDLMHMEYYTRASTAIQSRGAHRYATILGSRGCKHACSFCLQSTLHRRFAVRSPRQVVAEMEQVLSEYPQVHAFEFIDNLFLSDPQATELLCREMMAADLHRRVRWKAQTRASRLPKQTLRLMKEAGCFVLGVGFESGSQRVLDRMNKRITTDDIRETSHSIKEAGIQLEAYFIYGYPDETAEDFDRTVELIREIRPDYAGVGRFLLFPGTREYQRLVQESRVKHRHEDRTVDWEKVNVCSENSGANYTAMPDSALQTRTTRAFRRVIEPINLRYHVRDMGLRRMLSLSFCGRVIKNVLKELREPRYLAARAWELGLTAIRDIWRRRATP